MAFYGTSFMFDGIPSERFGLLLADIGDAKQSAGSIGTQYKIQEDRTLRRSAAFHYGAVQESAKSFPISFVVDSGTRRLDRYDIAAVAAWLTGHQQYKDLIVCQPDLGNVVYRCIITELEQVEVGMQVVGFKAVITCDSPYAYLHAGDTVVTCTGSAEILYRNLSNVNDYYYPNLTLDGVCASLSIHNAADGWTFALSGMAADAKTIRFDAESCVLTSSDGAMLYEHWNGCVPRFVRGDNPLTIAGACTLTIQNVFPWNVGS